VQTTEFINKANALSTAGKSFLFLIDFEMQKPKLWLPDEVNADELLFSINGFTNAPAPAKSKRDISLQVFPVKEEEYRIKFNAVLQELNYGNTFLANLTAKSRIEINTTLKELFFKVQAPYRCWLRNQFLFFSPESFVKISEDKIYTYPMKGTIDATIPNAASIILNNEKETAEHVTIVDLLRNDLSRVATNVRVSKFRYLDVIKTNRNEIIQVSSEIVGDIMPAYKNCMGSLLMELLPAGSICGAPKNKTVHVIQHVEKEPRGYYTGIFGYFDGKNLDSCVNIRFIEQQENLVYYRSGGGITTQSVWQSEYEEVIQKIYVPAV